MAARKLQRAPIGEIAQVLSGVGRQPCRHARRSRGDPQRLLPRPGNERHRSPRADRQGRMHAVHIGKEGRATVPSPCLDPQVRRAWREPEQQHEVRAVPVDQVRELALDRRIARREHMRDAVGPAERRPAAPRQAFGERRGRIERRAGERAESGDEHGQRHSQSHGLRDLVDRERRGKPSFGHRSLERGQPRPQRRIALEPRE